MMELSEREKKVQKLFREELGSIPKRNTSELVVVAMIGLPGSGKSSVASFLAEYLGATIIEGDKIRVYLRKEGESYSNVRKIAENITQEILEKGGNVILDSDHANFRKRLALNFGLKELDVTLVFVRAFMNLDVMLGRIITDEYHNTPDDFFGGASTDWDGDEQSQGAVVKLREMIRRTPPHYRWKNRGGGIWLLKRLRFRTIEVDATTEEWKDWSGRQFRKFDKAVGLKS